MKEDREDRRKEGKGGGNWILKERKRRGYESKERQEGKKGRERRVGRREGRSKGGKNKRK